MQTTDPSGGILAGVIALYGFLILLALASFVFWIVEIIDAARRQWPDPNTKIIWLLVIIFGHSIGAIVYFFAGRPSGWLPGQTPLASHYPPSQPPGQWPPPPGSV